MNDENCCSFGLVLSISGLRRKSHEPGDIRSALAPLECTDKDACDLAWQKTQFWIVSHSAYRIQVSNDTVIQTFGPFGSSTDLAFSATREPTGPGGAAEIHITAQCDNFIECFPHPDVAIATLKAYVGGGSTIQQLVAGATPTLGVRFMPLPDNLAQAMTLPPKHGLFVVSVDPDGAAGKAGLKDGDVILKYGEKPTNSASDLQSVMATVKTGDSMDLTVWRSSITRIVHVQF